MTSGVEIARESTSGNPQADLAVGQAYLAAVVLGRLLWRLNGEVCVSLVGSGHRLKLYSVRSSVGARSVRTFRV